MKKQDPLSCTMSLGDHLEELRARLILAIAGLVQTRTESQNRGLPWISEVPVLGVPFRRVEDDQNEIELLIMVTPELVEAIDSHEVPACGPGMQTTNPNDWELFFKGHLEVPNCCPSGPMAGGMPVRTVEPTGPILPDGTIIESRDGNSPPAPQDQLASARSRGVAGSSPEPVAASNSPPPGFIGPIGYDVVK